MPAAEAEAVEIAIGAPQDVVTARRQGLRMALDLGFSLPDATKIAVVVSELGRNILLYAGTGTILLSTSTGARRQLTVIARDNGPGIADVERASAGGYTTSGGLGLGLAGSRRLVDQFEIDSVVGRGTVVTATKWLRVR